MENEKSTPFRYIRYFLLAAAKALTAVAILTHSSIISPSIWIDNSGSWPYRYSLSLNGEEIEPFLPGRFSLDSGDVLVLEGDIEGYNPLKSAFLIPTDAPAFRIYLDGEYYAGGGSLGTGSFETNLQHSDSIIHLGRFPQAREISHIRIEYENTLGHRVTVMLDRLVIGSTFDLLAHHRAVYLLVALILIASLTIVFLSTLALLALTKSKSFVHIALAVLLAIVVVVQIIAANPFRSFISQNIVLWQVLNEASIAIMPAVLLLLVRKEAKLMEGWAIQILTLVAPSLLILSTLGMSINSSLFHRILHMAGGLSTVALAIQILIMIRAMKGGPRPAVIHHLASCFLVLTAYMMELWPIYSLNFYMSIHTVSMALRLLAVVCYIIFAITEYLGREQLSIGQLGLDDLLYRDPLTGCYNRRNLEHLKADGRYRDLEVLLITYDINDLKLVNDCFGHSEGDRVFAYFGSFVRSHLPEGASTFRIGGDEFVSVIPSALAPEDEEAFVKSLVEAFSERSVYSTSLASGWAWYHGGGEDAFDSALKLADERMYAMKKAQKEANPYPIWGGQSKRR